MPVVPITAEEPTEARLEIAYEVIGPPLGTADPFLLIMGLGSQLVMWPDGLCEQLAALGHPVIRFDNRDVGHSTRLDHLAPPPLWKLGPAVLTGRDPGAPYLLSHMAGDAVGLLDALDVPRAHLVGVSMGGMIAQLEAIHHPARVASLTSIMSTPGNLAAGLPRPAALRALIARPANPTPDAVVEQLVTTFRAIGSRTFPTPREDLARVARLSLERGVSGRGFARQLAAIAGSPNRTEALHGVVAPTLVLHGTEDPLVRPRGGRLTAEAIPGAELVLLEGMGHDLPRPLWPTMVDHIAGVALRAG